jgi:hypothetical protein
MQTPRQRKVAAVRENKRPQLFGGFVFTVSAFLSENALMRSSRYAEKRSVLLTPLISAAMPFGKVRARRTSPDCLTKGDPMHNARGTFSVDVHPLSPSPAEGIGRFSINKTIHGDIEATSIGEMFTGGDPKKGLAGYVAIEFVTGTLSGKHGSFALQHFATMDGKGPNMQVIVVPGSGTGELAGIEGTFTIRIENGKHFYDFEYALPE